MLFMPSESFELLTYCNVVFVYSNKIHLDFCEREIFSIAQLLTLRLKPKRIVTNGIPTLIMPWVASKYS